MNIDSPTVALIWEIWSRKRNSILLILGFTALGWTQARGEDPGVAVELLGTGAFLTLFSVFNTTEFDADNTRGFPSRLFTYPVSSLRLVAVPVLLGIAAVEFLYLLWIGHLGLGGTTGSFFTAVLLAGFMVSYQALLWMLARFGSVRLVAVGAVGIAYFGVGILPSFPESSASLWGSEIVLGGLTAGISLAVFLFAWMHVARLRSGCGRGTRQLEALTGRIAGALPRAPALLRKRSEGFASPAAAHFWYEWRCSGMVLPALVGGVLLLVMGPLSWFLRNDSSDTMRLLLGTLAMPVILAIPVGVAFSKPMLWSDDLSVPAFVAVRPLSTDDMVAAKVKVAALGAAISWLLVLTFLGLWLPLWANLESLSQLAIQLWAFHHHSTYAVYEIASLLVMAGMFLSWRFLIVSLWSGLSGSRALFFGSAAVAALVVTAMLVLDAGSFPGWILKDPNRMTGFVWIGALGVIAKYWLAARSWRDVSPRLLSRYLAIWIVGTAIFVTLGMVLWGLLRMYLPMDIYRFQTLVVLTALMVIPLWRLGLAPTFLERNRHGGTQ